MTLRRLLPWAVTLGASGAAIAVAATSAQFQWRDPVYIAAGLAGVLCIVVVLFQPLLASGALPGLPARPGRRIHRWTGAALIALVVAHVAGLWITSPPDAVDALLLRSPTPFSVWGVLAMWAVFASGGLALLRRRITARAFRLSHSALALVIVTGSILHALMITGTMGSLSKTLLCALALATTLHALRRLRVWRLVWRSA